MLHREPVLICSMESTQSMAGRRMLVGLTLEYDENNQCIRNPTPNQLWKFSEAASPNKNKWVIENVPTKQVITNVECESMRDLDDPKIRASCSTSSVLDHVEANSAHSQSSRPGQACRQQPYPALDNHRNWYRRPCLVCSSPKRPVANQSLDLPGEAC